MNCDSSHIPMWYSPVHCSPQPGFLQLEDLISNQGDVMLIIETNSMSPVHTHWNLSQLRHVSDTVQRTPSDQTLNGLDQCSTHIPWWCYAYPSARGSPIHYTIHQWHAYSWPHNYIPSPQWHLRNHPREQWDLPLCLGAFPKSQLHCSVDEALWGNLLQ